MKTDARIEHLLKYDSRLDFIRDRVKKIVKRFSHGLYLHGPGGISKSYTVIEALQAEGLKKDEHWTLLNGQITACGLFEQICRTPDNIILFEDCENFITVPTVCTLLRSALHSQAGYPRRVSWTTKSVRKNQIDYVDFNGSFIFNMNRPIEKSPALNAMKTRMFVLELSPTLEELEAKAWDIASQGHNTMKGILSSDECNVVCEFFIDVCKRYFKPLNFRELVNAFDEYLWFKSGDSKFDWKSAVESSLAGEVICMTRDQMNERKIQIAVAIHSREDLKAMEKPALFSIEAKSSQSVYYRCLSKAGIKR
ncbi:hypothetical protein [Zavarzinella formosa]|uniref:hypothetical protein n=1 Tax=Zavarzinella formosa TaxID=360055 RepID=UPI00036E74E1|nr:hypothetical protein [Zavarzinella formosa]